MRIPSLDSNSLSIKFQALTRKVSLAFDVCNLISSHMITVLPITVPVKEDHAFRPSHGIRRMRMHVIGLESRVQLDGWGRGALGGSYLQLPNGSPRQGKESC